MKEDIEEPVKKSWKLFLILILILIFLMGIGVLLIVWYLENSQNPEYKTDITRISVSGIAVLLLIITLIVILVNLYRPKKSKAKKTARISSENVAKRRTSTTGRKSSVHKRVKK